MMNIKFRCGVISGILTVLLAVSSPAKAQPISTQPKILQLGAGRFTVEIPSASLTDALEAVYAAAGNPMHKIAEGAKTAMIGASTFRNVNWHDIVRLLATQNGFVMRHDTEGTCLIEPRPTATKLPDATHVTSNNVVSSLTTIINQASGQTTPALQGNKTGSAGEEPIYQILPVRHIYVGGIARLFTDSDTITTEDFLVPDSAFGGGGLGGGGGFGGGGFGGRGSFGGGFGGMGMGGMGMGGMGMGGMGMGGMGMGGMGMGGMGMGGFGGGRGGFGGGMGGMGGGFGRRF